MGAGIAQKFAMEGAEVQLLDLSEEAVSRGLASIRSTLEQGVERRVLRPNQLEETMSRLTGTTDMRDLIGCDLIIEAVFEDLQVKRDVFSKLDAICGQETLLATNTSSFRVSELQSGLGRPERLLGLHFFVALRAWRWELLKAAYCQHCMRWPSNGHHSRSAQQPQRCRRAANT